MLADNVFRANVGIILFNGRSQVLALERAAIPGAWQLPQGGLEPGEELIAAAKRELWEETGIDKNAIELVAEYPEWLAYELPMQMRTKKHGRGQVQKWLAFRLIDNNMRINLESTAEPEFRAYRWMHMSELVTIVPDFRKGIYKKLAEWTETISQM